MDVTLVRPKDTPIATGFSDTDKFFIDSDIGIRNFTGAQLKTTIATAFVGAPGTYSLATLGVDGKVPTSQLPATLTGALAYKGTVAGASVAATSTAAGDYFVITSAGTSQSKTWAVGDIAIYKGTSGQWDQLTAGVTQIAQGGTGATTAAAARTALAVLADHEVDGRVQTTAGGLVFDATSGKFVQAMSQAVGANDCTLRFKIRVPTANPASTVYIAGLGANSASSVNSLYAAVTNTGALYVAMVGGTTSDYNSASLSGFVAAYGGKEVEVEITRATTTLTVYANGAAQTVSFGTTGSAPGWDAALASAYLTVGNIFAGASGTYSSRIHAISVFNLCLTAQEVADMVVYGIPSSMKGASCTPLSLPNGGFESDAAGYVISAVSATGSGAMWKCLGNHVGTVVADASVEGSNALEIVASAAGGAASGNDNLQRDKPTHTVGKRYRFSFRAKTISGNTALSAAAGGGDGSLTGTLTGSYQKFTVEYTSASATGTMRICIGGAGTFRVDDIRWEQIGAFQDLDLAVGFGTLFPDRSGNELHGYGSNGGWLHLVPCGQQNTLSWSDIISRDVAVTGGILLDGTPNKGLDGPAPALGSGDFTVWQRVRVPYVVQSGTFPTIFAIREDANNVIWCFFGSGQRIFVNVVKGGVANSNVFNWDATPFGGATIDFKFKRVGTSLYIYVNKVLVAINTHASNDVAFTSAARMQVGNYTGNGTAAFTSGIYRHAVFNYAVSNADMGEVLDSGIVQKLRPGSMTPVYNPASFTTTDSWSAPSAGLTLTGGYTDGGGQANTLRVQNLTGAARRCDVMRSVTGISLSRRYKFTVTIYNENIPNAFFNVGNAGYAPLAGSTNGTYIAPGRVGTVTGQFDTVDYAGPNNIRVGLAATPEGSNGYTGVPDGGGYSIRSITVTPIGAVQDLNLTVGAGHFFPDRTGNGYWSEATATGWVHKLGRQFGEFCIVKTLQHSDISATAETTLLLNLPANVGVIDIEMDRETAFDSGITLRVGPTGANTKYVNDQAVAATGKVLVTPYSGGGASEGSSSYFPIWIKKSGATTQGVTTVRVRCAIRG